MDMDRFMYEVDMERMYEDSSFPFDEVNGVLQEIGHENQEEAVEAAYDEMLESIMRFYYPQYEEFDL